MKHLKLVLNITLLLLMLIPAGSALTENGKDNDSIFAGKGSTVEKTHIEGTITDSYTGKPVSGATVEIKNSSRGVGYYKTVTDRKGEYRIDDFIPYIRYDIEITAPGYVTYSETASFTNVKNDIKLTKESVITGTVRDSSGKPIPGVEIKLRDYSEYNSNRPLFVKSDSSGSYRIDKLNEGSYMVTFSMPGYISESASLKQIRAGESFNLQMVMYRPASISGNIGIRGLDSPAVDINISADGRYRYSNVSYRDGSFILEDIKPGTYTLTMSHQGFHTVKSENIQIREGADVKDLRFTVEPKSPEVKIHSYRYTFTPGNEISFNLRTMRLDQVHVKIYQVPANVFVSGTRDAELTEPKESGFKTVTEWDETVNDFKPYEWMYYSVKVDRPLSPGGYCIEAMGKGGVFTRQFFTVTDLGVVLKRSPENITAYVTDLVHNRPLKNVSVIIYNENLKLKGYRGYSPGITPGSLMIEQLPVKVLARGKTDKDGIFRTGIQSQKDVHIVAVSDNGSYAICSGGSSGYYVSEKEKMYIYTDRPVYRAGDSLFFKIVAKRMEKKFVPIKNRTIYYSIQRGGSSKKLASGTLRLDEWGTANSSVKIPASSELGYFSINAGFTEKNLYAGGSFHVEQYRKPEFKIEITPSKEFFINGDTAEFKVDAKYFFGAPLNGALVRYTFYERKIEDIDPSFNGDDMYSSGSSYSRIKLEGEKFSDNGGSALLKVDTGTYPYDREIILEATVTDRSNVSITSRKTVRVGRGEFFITISPEENFYSSDGKKNVTVRTADHVNRPVSANLEISLFKYIWKPVQRVYVHDSRAYYTKKITTGKDGTASFSLPSNFTAEGEFQLLASARDSRDNLVTGSKIIWIYRERGGDVASKFRELEVTLNKNSFDKSGELTCLVKSKFTDSYVMLTLEGRDVYETKVIKMDRHVMPVTFRIDKKYAPNLFVRGAMQRGRALYTTESEVMIPVDDVKINITLTPQKEKYGPGETAKIAVRALDSAGKPVSADISLSAVDESIYYIRPDTTPEISGFFYSKISNWVLTTYSFPITLLAGAGKDSAVKVRENFRDTAFWKADIKTGSDGNADVSFTLPDNLTTWRLTARGHDIIGRMGESRKKFISTQDLIARIGKPRFMIEGDRTGLIGIVNNNTDTGITSVSTEMKAGGDILKPEKDFMISLPGYGSASKLYSLTVPGGKESIPVEFMAKGGANQRDAVRYSIPVEKRGLQYVVSGSGDMKSAQEIKLEPLKDNDDFEFVPEEIFISVNPSPVNQIIKSVEYLNRYPYGCLEQTINKFLPNLAMLKLIKGSGFENAVPDELKKQIESSIPDGIARLVKSQNYDGSWGWWEGDRGNTYITGFALYSLYNAKKYRYSVSSYTINNGLAAVKRMLGSDAKLDHDERSYLLYIYSLFGKWDHKTFRDIAFSKKLNPYQAANLMKSAALFKGAEKLQEHESREIEKGKKVLAEKISSSAKRDSSGLYWPAEDEQSWNWPGGNTEITAHVLSALLLSGDKSGMVSEAAASISRRFKGLSWYSTKETGTVIMALCDYLSQSGLGYKSSGEIEFTLNGSSLEKISYSSDSPPESLQRTVAIKSSMKSSSYTLKAAGSGSPEITFTASLRGTMYFKPKGVFSIFKSEKSGIESISSGIKARREISFLNRVRDNRQQEYLVPAEVGKDGKVKVGDELMVRVKFRAEESYGFMMLQDFLPAGFEVVKESAYNGFQPYSHIERRDNRMVFFFTGIEKGMEYEVAYVIRAELPGSYIMRPARIECMYQESIQGWSLPVQLEVTSEKSN